MINVMFSIRMKKMNEIMINITMWINTENFLSGKKLAEKTTQIMLILHTLNPTRFFKMREHPSNE